MTVEAPSVGEPPAGYTFRPCTMQDLAEVLALINAGEVADYGDTEETEVSLKDHWKVLALGSDSILLVDSHGQIAGYADQAARNPVRLEAFVRVHPAHTDRGLGTRLTSWAHARAVARVPQAPPGARVTVEFGAAAANEAGTRLLENQGWALVHAYLRMTIEFDEPPHAPVWPAGVRFRAFVLGEDDYAVYAALDEAFHDHWGYVTVPFELSMQRAVERESFDPTLWFLATEGDEITGASICAVLGEFGWVNTLGVRRPWRKRGVGLALLQHSFAELYRRGQRKMGLGVDAESLTGATRLYEKAGMKADRRHVYYAEELRPGRELATQTLEEAAK